MWDALKNTQDEADQSERANMFVFRMLAIAFSSLTIFVLEPTQHDADFAAASAAFGMRFRAENWEGTPLGVVPQGKPSWRVRPPIQNVCFGLLFL